MAFSKYSSIFLSSDLEFLQKVFDQLCQERRLAIKDRDQRNQLAIDIMEAFQNGFTEETELWRLFSKRRASLEA